MDAVIWRGYPDNLMAEISPIHCPNQLQPESWKRVLRFDMHQWEMRVTGFVQNNLEAIDPSSFFPSLQLIVHTNETLRWKKERKEKKMDAIE